MFDLVLRHVPAPALNPDLPFGMVASILDYDNFLGRVLTGRVEQGTARLNMPLKVLRADGSVVETGRLTKLMSFRGLERIAVEEAIAGDIIAVAGLMRRCRTPSDHRTWPNRCTQPRSIRPPWP